MKTNLKIAQHTYSKAHSLGILNEVCWYYDLKRALPDHGSFLKSELNSIRKKLRRGVSMMYRMLSRLKRVGLIKKTKLGWSVVSYDKLFKSLGNDIRKIKGRSQFKIIQINKELTRENSIKNILAYTDIRCNLKHQKSRVKTLYKKQRQQYTANNNCTLEEMLSLKGNHVPMQDDYSYNNMKSDKKRTINFDITLSLQGVCEVLGLSNTSSAHKIITELTLEGLLRKKTRSIKIADGSYADFKALNNPRLRYRDGIIVRQLSNKLSPLV